MADMLIMHAVEALIVIPATRESSEDLREGLEAFGAKRKPRFRANDPWRGDSRSLRGVAADWGPRVRIHLPPADSTERPPVSANTWALTAQLLQACSDYLV
jgi:hypothetical protein